LAPPEEAAAIAAVAPDALAPGTAPAVAMPAPSAPPEEVAPIVAVAPDARAPGTAPVVPRRVEAAPPEERSASTVEISALLARGDSLFGTGDVTSARLFYERATNAGDAQAALRLGETYDPFFLAWARLNGVRGDLAVATRWYQRARDLGAREAETLLKSIENK
jgi:TPR repeat protein